MTVEQMSARLVQYRMSFVQLADAGIGISTQKSRCMMTVL